MMRLFALAVLLGLLSLAPAGEFNKVLSPGDAAPAWTDLEGTDGKKHSLGELKDKPVVVVIFTCNSCPVANDYEARIQAFADKYKAADSKVAIVAINVNTIKDDQLPAMKKRAEKNKYSYAYLYDPSQEIARKYGANYTPEFFVLNAERKVVYCGALDDKNKAVDAKTNYLEAAVSATLSGQKPATTETLARGCKIRFNKKNDE